MPETSHLRPLGATDIRISSVAMGCWPIAGMTSLGVTREDSLATLRAALDSGVNFFDTAYAYGVHGESERLIGEALGAHRDEIVVATKAGLHWDAAGSSRVWDARPETLKKQCEESLQRLGFDNADLLYLHAPDPNTPIEESAGALRELMQQGKARAIGASNLSLEQLKAFHAVCPLSAYQPPYNMLQREIEADILPWCRNNQISTVVYWPLLKGLLAGKLPRDHQFDAKDGRTKYPMFQGEEWHKNQDFVERLREIAEESNVTVAELVVNWTIEQPGIDSALCGAKRAYQIEESAAAMRWRLSDRQREQIEQALQDRGAPLSVPAV